MSDITPIGVLEYLLDNVGGYLPYPVRSFLYLTLRGLYCLPSSVANVLPLLLGAFVLYSSAMSMFSTFRYAIRTAWFLAKWGLVVATIVWATGFGTGGSTSSTARSGAGVGRAGGWPGQQQFGGIASQLYGAAAGNNDFLQNNNLGFLYNFVPAPLRAVGNLASFFSGAADTSSSRTTRRSTRESKRKQQEQAEQLNDIGQMAQSWLGGMAGKAWDTFNEATAGNQDRWTEGRQRREDQRRRNR